MSFLFKRSKIKCFITSSIRLDQEVKINLYRAKLAALQGKPLTFFGVSAAFILGEASQIYQQEGSKFWEESISPYSKSVKLMSELRNAISPITKLKTVVGVAKSLLNEVHGYYKMLGRETPEMDPDNLSSIVMWLLVEEGDYRLW